jgi:protoheme ferro-lyase
MYSVIVQLFRFTRHRLYISYNRFGGKIKWLLANEERLNTEQSVNVDETVIFCCVHFVMDEIDIKLDTL